MVFNNPNPPSYSDVGNLFEINRECKACSLSCGTSVPGVHPTNMEDIKLIVILDYPNKLDFVNYAAFPDETKRQSINTRYKMELEKQRNGSNLLRILINEYLQIDHQENVAYLYAIKCPPDNKTVQDKHIRTCTRRWLEKEIAVIDLYKPNVPILICGSTSLKALKLLDPTFKSYKLNDLRRSTGHLYKQHPLVFSFMPSSCKGEARIEVHTRPNTRKHISEVISFKKLGTIFGSPLWIFSRDLIILREYLL